MQHGVVSLWSLLEACRVGSDVEQQQAALHAQSALREPDSCEAGLTLELVDSLLMVDGYPAVSGADSFAATHGLIQFLRDAAIVQVRIAGDVAAHALGAWATLVVAKSTNETWPKGIDVAMRSEAGAADVVTPHPRAKAGSEVPASRLRSVFLQHRLIAGLPAIAGVDATVAKLVIQGVVDRLLQVQGGLEPLMLLQQDEVLLRRSTAVAVLAVVFARHAGWPSEQLTDLGAAALLHDVGAILDPAQPAAASFAWLLERGNADFWLRCALVARRWRDGLQASSDPAGPLAVVGVVRLAVVAYDQGAAGIGQVGVAGAAPQELVALAQQALAIN